MNKLPRFHVSKRGALPWWEALLIRGASLVLALLTCAVVTMLLTGENPLNIFSAMLSGSFGTPRKLWALLQGIAILLCVSLAVTPAFRMRFWNVGGEGQILMGGLACAACMIYLGDKVPSAVIILCMVVSSIVAGAVWGGIPAFFKARWNTNETLFTLMMNYIATQLVAFFCNIWDKKGSGVVGIINPSSEAGWLPVLFGQRYALNVIVVSLLVIFVHIYLTYSKHGYELTVVGESERTARYVGIKVENVIVRTMLLSGALCGVAGLLLVGGTDHSISTATAGGRGFTAVMVSWLAKFNPVSMIFTAFLIVFLERGSGDIVSRYGLNKSFSDILTGIILFFIIGSEFFLTYRLDLVKGAEKEAK